MVPAVALVLAACGKTTVKADPETAAVLPDSGDANPAGFSLSIPEEKWGASRFCGPTTPTTPTDPTPQYRFDDGLLSEKLAGAGLTGWVHGSVPQYETYVFTYRKEDPTDVMAFFKAEQFSLVPASKEVGDLLATLKRHDKIRLKGEIFDNGAPLTHLLVTGVEVLEPYALPTDNEYAFDAAKLNGQEKFPVFGLIHATVDSDKYGRALVLEHDDFIMPVIVPPALNDATAKLMRGDIVNAAVKMVVHPHGPPHFELDATAAAPLTVVDPMLNCHGLQKTVTGYLVKFNKSPAISVDVYAVRVVDANGIGRNFTLFPDTDDEGQFGEIFQAISDKASGAWDASPQAPAVVRNFWKKDAVKISVSGMLNVVSSEQANAQVYIKSADAITVGE